MLPRRYEILAETIKDARESGAENIQQEFDRVFRVNTRGQFFVAREAYRHLSIGGRIILTSSNTASIKGVPKHAVYSGSKGAIETFVRCMVWFLSAIPI
jgi:NAD(P)-dependent dehydrogenase (short-subunit alcohol dehydrogenase family)